MKCIWIESHYKSSLRITAIIVLLICVRLPISHEARYSIQGNASGKNPTFLLPFCQRPAFISRKQLKFWGPKALSHLAGITKAWVRLAVTGHDLQPWPTSMGSSLSLVFPKANSITNCKNPAVKLFPRGAECLSPLWGHTVGIPQLLVGCQSPLPPWLHKYRAVQLEGKRTGDLVFPPLNLHLDC